MSKNKQPIVVNIHLSPDTPLMPNGRPVPDILTADQVLEYLGIGEGENAWGDNPHRGLSRLREKGWLIGFKCGRYVKFTRKAVMDCLNKMAEEGAE